MMPKVVAASVYLLYAVVFLGICSLPKRTAWLVAILILGLFTGYVAHMASVILYWRLSEYFATTEEEIDAINTSDGGSLLGNGLLFAPTTSLALCLFGWIAFNLSNWHRNSRYDIGSRVYVARNEVTNVIESNPYAPPKSDL